jgi:hypothetical protein
MPLRLCAGAHGAGKKPFASSRARHLAARNARQSRERVGGKYGYARRDELRDSEVTSARAIVQSNGLTTHGIFKPVKRAF